MGATRGIGRFAGTSLWYGLPAGEPVFHAARAWMRCKLIERVDASGATLYLTEVVETNITHDTTEQDASEGPVCLNRTWHRFSEESRVGCWWRTRERATSGCLPSRAAALLFLGTFLPIAVKP